MIFHVSRLYKVAIFLSENIYIYIYIYISYSCIPLDSFSRRDVRTSWSIDISSRYIESTRQEAGLRQKLPVLVSAHVSPEARPGIPVASLYIPSPISYPIPLYTFLSNQCSRYPALSLMCINAWTLAEPRTTSCFSIERKYLTICFVLLFYPTITFSASVIFLSLSCKLYNIYHVIKMKIWTFIEFT